MIRRSSPQDSQNSSIPRKANVVLNLILVAFFLIGVRIWHLSVIEYDEKFEQSKKPQRKTVVEPAKRATIRDRFNIPLAINKVAYRAGVSYAPIRSVPSVVYEMGPDGKKVKVYKRKEYIKRLSELLGKELDQDAGRIEDLIYSKAALFFNIPYILKEELSEEEYYKLRMLEKDWVGLTVERYSKREYPKGKLAADIIGYTGAISKNQYEDNIREMKALGAYLTAIENGENPPLPEGFESPHGVRRRHLELEELAYTTQDFVGKTGIEGLFEEQLRGYRGKKSYYSDSKGNFLTELPGKKDPVPGKRVLLSISSELQEYAEKLLAQNEEVRLAKSSGHGKSIKNKKQPWIKGGAIVVLDPQSGEVLTLATFPRFDPNDFTLSAKGEKAKQKQKNISRWFESEAYLADLWNEIIPLQKEHYDKKTDSFYEEEKWVTWNNYLEFMLPKAHPILKWFEENGTIGNVMGILNSVDELESSGKPLREIVRKDPPSNFLPFLETPYTKLLFVDCCQIALNHTAFSKELLKYVKNESIESHKEAASAYVALQEGVKQITKDLFHESVFQRWRELNEKSFLKQKREEEKLSKSYPKPYIDYLDEKENELFQRFWNQTRLDLVLTLLFGQAPGNQMKIFTSYFETLHKEFTQGAHPGIPWKQAFDRLQAALKKLPLSESREYLATLRSYNELKRPLKGSYKSLKNGSSVALEKHLAAAFYPRYGFGYGRSQAFRQAATQGSIFKLVTTHEALSQVNEESLKKGKGIRNKNPLEVTDDIFKIGNQTYVGYTTSGKPIPQLYKGGRIPRSHRAHLGKMDLLEAIGVSSNVYFSLLASDVLKSPQDLANAAKRFGFGKKTGIDLPFELAGKVPTDLETNRTGLYAMSIGQHTLVVTPLQTAVFLASLANGGDLLKPQIVKVLAGHSHGQADDWLKPDQDAEDNAALHALGIDFPLFDTPSSLQKRRLLEKQLKTIKSHVEMPPSLRNILLEGMHRVVLHTHKESLGALAKIYNSHPEAMSDYIDLKNQLIGKTSTSESMERIDFDEEEGTNLYTHLWFGGISFKQDVTKTFDNPELVVVVYLRFGGYGKEAAPLAAQIVNKWREINER